MISYTMIDSSLGYLLLAGTQKGICTVRFGTSEKKLEAEVKKEFEKQIFNGTPESRSVVP